MKTLALFALGISVWADQAAAACVADGPVATARWVRAHQDGFAVYQSPQDASAMRRFLSPRFLGLLKVEWQCQVIEEGLCAVDADPWTNALEGKVLGPITFDLAAQAGSTSTVTMRFRFGASDTDPHKPTAAQATLKLAKNTGSGCWQLDDLVGSKGRSLAKQLRSYTFYP